MTAPALLSAAGASLRFGGLKALAPWGGQSLLAHQVEALLAGGCGPVIVLLGAEAPRLAASLPPDPRVLLRWHPGWAEGRASGLRAGLATLRALGLPPGPLVLASVDQPTRAEVVAALLAAWGPAWPLVLPTHLGRRGHPTLWSGALWPELAALQDATEGLRPLVRALAERRLEVEVPWPVDLDLNRPEDWAAAQAWAP